MRSTKAGKDLRAFNLNGRQFARVEPRGGRGSSARLGWSLLLPMPATVSDHTELMRLLRSCTMHGVAVSLVLLAGEAWPDGLPIPSGKARRT